MGRETRHECRILPKGVLNMKYRPYCGADLAGGAASFCMERGKSLPTAEGRGIFAVPFGDQRRGAQVYADRCGRRQQNAADHADLRPDERTGEIEDGNAERESGSSPLPEMRRGKTRTLVRPHTVLEDFPLFCPKRRYTCVIRFRNGKIEEIDTSDAQTQCEPK